MKRFLLPLLALACAGSIYGGLRVGGIVINHTPSLPEGFYRRQNVPVQRGCVVLFHLPAAQGGGRPYAQENLLKQVAAVAGDRVSVGPTGVRVNGQLLANSVPLRADREGASLSCAALDNHVLGPNELFTMSTYNPRSFDSRYFGPVRQEHVIAVVTPVWTW